MDPEGDADTRPILCLDWKSYKLLQDPATRRVARKIYRFDGIYFSEQDSEFTPVGELRDPRPRRIWSRPREISLPLPKFKLDEYYVGPIPLKEVTFARLNDNIKEPFLLEMCTKFGEVEEMEILFHPKTRKHLGLARVLFSSTRGAKDTVKQLNNTSIMGNIVHVQLDIKGQQRMKYYDLIVNGTYTPQTVPTGGKAFTEKFQPPTPAQPDTSSDVRRKLSTDQVPVELGVGDQRLDTPPSSLGGPYTPGSSCSSQGGATPYTSRSGTPFSQDSGYSGSRSAGYTGGPLGGAYPPTDMLPSSSCSSAAVSSSSGFKPSRYHDDPQGAPPQDAGVFQRGRPGFPPPPNYPPYHGAGGPGMHMPHHPPMPPSGFMYDSPPVAERERDRDRGPRDRDFGRYGGSRRSSYPEPDRNSSSKSAYHSHHREERDGRQHRRDSSGSREHGRHRNHHHSHNHHSRRRDSRDRDADHANSADPRHRGHANSSHRSSNSHSPPPTSYGYNSSKDPPTPSSSRPDPATPARSGERPAPGPDPEYRPHPHHTPLQPPPPPPPLPPASVIAAAVAETLGSLDFGPDSPAREERWTKPKRRPSTPPQPPRTPPPPSSPPRGAAVPSSSTSPPSAPPASAPPGSPTTNRGDSSPEPDSTNESLPFTLHSSSLDSRIEMLLKDQKSKFSFLASDDDDDKKEESRQQGRERKPRGEAERSRKEARRNKGRKAGAAEERKSPAEAPSNGALLSESTPGPQPPADDAPKVTGAHTPPAYNGEGKSPRSSGEDMEISDDDGAATPHRGSSPASSAQPAAPAQASDPAAGAPDSTQHFGASIPPPHMPSFPPHLPPPPPPGFSLQPPPPGLPPPHMYDYTSMELLSQYGGTSFQMQAHMLSRLHQMREKHAAGSEYPPPSFHLHSMPPPPPPPHAPPPHHPYIEQDGTAGNHYDQDHRYMPPHMPAYPYPEPHAAQLPPPHPHSLPPPPPDAWPPHILPQHFPSHYPPPGYGAAPAPEGEQFPAPDVAQNPNEVTVQLVLAALMEEMKNTMQRDLNRKMVENVAFGTFDQWWERKERKAKPFQTVMRSVSEEKKEEKANSRAREPLMSLVDWAKSGGVEGFSLLGSLRLPSFKVKRKEPLEFEEDASPKRTRPSTPPDEEDEDSYQGKDAGGSSRPEENRVAERAAAKRRKRPKARKPYDLDSEGEETSDESSSEKEEDSEKESDDEAASADSDDEGASSSSESSSSSSSSTSSSSSDDDEERPEESESLDTMDESTTDSVAVETEREKDTGSAQVSEASPAAPVKPDINSALAPPTDRRPPSPPGPRPSSPILPPLKKRRKTVSFTTDEGDAKALAPPSAPPLSPSSASQSLLLSPVKSQPPDQLISSSPAATPASAKPAPMLCPFATRPGKPAHPASSPSDVLTIPPPVRSLRPEEPRKGPQPAPAKSPSKRPGGKESPRATPAGPVCLTVQNLPMDHASMVKVAFEEPVPASPGHKGRARGRSRTSSQSARPEDEEEAHPDAPDLSVLARVAAEMDEEVDSEETETSDEAEEHRQDEDEEAWLLRVDPGGLSVLHEHNYARSPALLTPHPAAHKRPRADGAALLPTDLNVHCVQEAPEEVIGEVAAEHHAQGGVSGLGLVGEAGESGVPGTPVKKRGAFKREEEPDKGRSRKRSTSHKENVDIQPAKRPKEERGKKPRKGKLEDPEDDVDVERLEGAGSSGSSSESADSDFGPDGRQGAEKDEVRKSERLFLQEAGVTPSTQRRPAPPPTTTYKQRSEFEQMTILYDIWNTGLDQEDMRLLKETYEKLLQKDQNTDWLNDTHWVPHTITNIRTPRRKKKSADAQLREHVTGSARSEGYYAISRKEKDVYMDLEVPETGNEAVDFDTAGSNRLLAERRSEQRRLLSAIGTQAVMDSDLLKLNQLKFRKKKLRFGRSRIHEWGLFAMEPIAADEMVIEYVGQNIRQMVADTREKRYAQEGIGSSYLFRVDHDTIIDATKCGNLARFINHCCTPNCYAKVITIESQKKIVIYSKQPIAVNEEITYDYKFPIEENKIPCLCGTENCRGTLN